MSHATAREILEHALARRPTLGAGRVVAVDGPSGAGKTTLAAAIEAAAPRHLDVATLHLDDVYAGWHGLASLGDDLHGLLTPLAEGRRSTWHTWDWATDSPGGLREQDPVELLVLEGVGAGHRQVADLVTLLVWLDGPPDRLDRSLARDVARHASAAADAAAYRARLVAWQQDEAAHYAVDATRERADIALG
ncbi:uridine kinase family protein [Nocardioides jiangxiensis]|uniref:4-amino-4-deoxy-L-arabinose transferase n=1 Tax=Nocardioides jiangxiensis TaxID=3064524 RepID=A0ABT9B5H0_9ACTN|nr:4-amino-4-deoxy-L-arabinose transferase [Nocardioides sp. WY-20]MDO7869640.1 4-amino-4-deoxy-L-arabinose transferase [Nocardioides sp. WY-20]